MWDLTTGDLIRTWQAHYKTVGALAFSPCGRALVSGGADGMVHVWETPSLVDMTGLADLSLPVAPFVTWTEHSLPVTSVSFTSGASAASIKTPSLAACKVVTTSLDRSLRVWDVPSRRCLLKATFPSPVRCAAVDPLEQRVYGGCEDGCIYPVDIQAAAVAAAAPTAAALQRLHVGGIAADAPPAVLLRQPLGAAAEGAESEHSSVAAPWADAGDAAAAAVAAAGIISTPSSGACFAVSSRAVGAPAARGVNAIAVTPDGGFLLSASDDGVVRVWDALSRQVLHVYEGHRGPVVALALLPQSPKAASGGSGSSSIGSGAGGSLLIRPLKKHHVPLTAEWIGSTTGPLDKTPLVRLAPTMPSVAAAAKQDAALQSALAGLLDVLQESAGAGGAGAASVAATGVEEEAAAPAAKRSKGAAAEGAAPAAAAASAADEAELAALRARVAALEEENARWKAVNNKLAAKLGGKQ